MKDGRVRRYYVCKKCNEYMVGYFTPIYRTMACTNVACEIFDIKYSY
jgi:hypothetical protein